MAVRLLILLVVLASMARPEPQPDRVQIKVLTDPPGAWVIPERRGAVNPDDRTPVGRSGGTTLVIPVPPEQQTLTLHLEHWLCVPRTVTLDLNNYRSLNDTYGPEKLEYRSWAHALLGKLQPWVAALLAMVLVAAGLYLRQWRLADRVRRQAELDSARAGEILNRIVPAAGDPMVGALLDGYRLTEKLGQGGMARVYKGQPEGTSGEHEAVAIKILEAELAAEEQFVRRFNREKDVYADLNHPNIVRVLGFGTFQEHYYLVMELIRGTTLRKQITPGGIPPAQVLRTLRPVFQAVAYAHSRGVVHRDLKPENIMVTDAGRIKVMDFGMAAGKAYSAVTVTGSLLGTPAYMAPEQAQGQLDPRSDQYALGILVYEMLTGKPPFMDDNPVNIVLKHLGEEPPSLADIRPDLEGVSPVVQRMLAKSPDERYADVEQALAALEQVLR